VFIPLNMVTVESWNLKSSRIRQDLNPQRDCKILSHFVDMEVGKFNSMNTNDMATAMAPK
jgi:hypothetical protein